MIKLGEMMILDLHRQGLSVSAIAKATGADRKTVRKYIARGLELPAYGVFRRASLGLTHMWNGPTGKVFVEV